MENIDEVPCVHEVGPGYAAIPPSSQAKVGLDHVLQALLLLVLQVFNDLHKPDVHLARR